MYRATRYRRALVASTAALVLSATAAFAASVHLKNNRAPRLADNGLTATVTGALAGLGNGDVTITCIAEGDGSVVLHNPGGNFVPGQNKVPIVVSGSQTISADEIKNGNVSFRVTTDEPETPTPDEAGAPNDNWEVILDDVDFTGFTVIVEQGGEVVLVYESPAL